MISLDVLYYVWGEIEEPERILIDGILEKKTISLLQNGTKL
jgi:hypothetical protein